MKNVLVVTVGPSCSGKTTFAEQYVKENPNTINLNRDDVRFTLFANRDGTKYKFKRSKEQAVTNHINNLANAAVKDKKDIIVSDTNLSFEVRGKWKRFAEQSGYLYSEVEFSEAPWEELRKKKKQSTVWRYL